MRTAGDGWALQTRAIKRSDAIQWLADGFTKEQILIRWGYEAHDYEVWDALNLAEWESIHQCRAIVAR